MDMTRKCISFIFDPSDILLSLKIGFSFDRAAVAYAIPESKPSSDTIAPMYLKLVTAPSFCPLTLISLWMPLALFFISFVFSALISILYFVETFNWASNFCSSSARASMLSANRRLVMVLPLMLNFPLFSCRASEIDLSRKTLKRVSEKGHSYLTPTVAQCYHSYQLH